jgi:hypothetical protein
MEINTTGRYRAMVEITEPVHISKDTKLDVEFHGCGVDSKCIFTVGGKEVVTPYVNFRRFVVEGLIEEYQ